MLREKRGKIGTNNEKLKLKGETDERFLEKEKDIP